MLERLWYRKSGWRWLLAPFALLFAIISGTRRYAYRHGWRKGYRSSLPVIVVGNISVGATARRRWWSGWWSSCKPAAIDPGW